MCTHLFFLQVDCDRLVSSPFQTSSSFIITITMGKSFLVWFGVFGQLKQTEFYENGWVEGVVLIFQTSKHQHTGKYCPCPERRGQSMLDSVLDYFYGAWLLLRF